MSFNPDWVSPPGDTIQSILSEKNISIVDFSKRINLNLHEIQLLLIGKKRIDKLLAEKLSCALGSTDKFWMKRDNNYVRDCKRLGKSDYKP